jgi:hypothetical protein
VTENIIIINDRVKLFYTNNSSQIKIWAKIFCQFFLFQSFFTWPWIEFSIILQLIHYYIDIINECFLLSTIPTWTWIKLFNQSMILILLNAWELRLKKKNNWTVMTKGVKSKEGSNVMYVWMENSLEIVRICMIQGKCQQLSFGYYLIFFSVV